MSNEIATYSMILSKLSLGKSGTECPTKTQILAINSLIVIDNASTYGANECVKIDDIRKKAETWNYYLTVSPTSMSFGAGGGSKQFTYSSYKRKVLDGVEQSGDISVSLKTTSASGTGFSISGTTVSASANEGTSNRTGTVTITQNESNKTATISLSQSGDTISSYGEWTISVSANPTSVSSDGGTSTITASAKRTVYWASGDVTEETGNPTLSTNLGSLSSTSSPSTLTLGENTSTSSRTATITATYSGKSATCTVTQAAGESPDVWDYVFSVNPYQVSVGSGGGSGTVTITSYETLNGSWYRDVSYSIDSSTLPSWATYDGGGSFTISANTSSSSRSAQVYFVQDESGNRDYASLSQDAYVPPADTYVFTWDDGTTADQSMSLPYQGSSAASDFVVISTKNGSSQSWSVSSKPSWVGTSTSGNTLYVTVDANSGSARSGEVVLTQSGSGKTLTVNVSQDAKPADEYVFEIADSSSGPYGSSVSWTLPASGSLNKDIYLHSKKNGENVGWSASSNASWIIVVRDYPDFYWEYENNNTAYSRSGKITFTQEGSGKKVYLNLTQEGKPQITFTATVAGKNIHTQSWDAPTTAKTVSAVLPFPSSWSTSDEFKVKLRYNGMSDGSWTGSTQTGTMANYDRKSSITIENNRDSSVTFTVEYWFKGMDYIFHMWPADNTSGVYTSGTQSVDLQIVSRFFKEQHPLKVQSQPEWCTAYISGSDGNGIYNIDLLIQSNPLTQSRTGTIVFEQEDSGMTTSFTVSQGGATLKDNKLTITSLSYDTAFLFPAGITPVEDSNTYLSFIVPNTFTWKTSTGLTINRGTIYAGELAKIYVRENNRYKLVKSFQLETGEQTITI